MVSDSYKGMRELGRWSPNVAALPNEVCDYPVFFSLLEMFHGKRSQFRSPEPASEEDSNHGVVTLATKIPIVEDCKKPFPLFSSQPVANPHAVFLHAFHASDACRQVRTEKSASRPITPAVGPFARNPSPLEPLNPPGLPPLPSYDAD